MMIGTCRIENGAVITSKTTYLITKDTRPDVRLIFKAPALLCAGGLSVFGVGFSDLLYPEELAAIFICISGFLIAGFQLARLVILDRVTRGTEQMSAIYGLHATLQKRRSEIDAVLQDLKGGAS